MLYRVDAGRSRESGGTGLGLAIVKHVVQRHGGALDIESTLGAGSRFRLVFSRPRPKRRLGGGRRGRERMTEWVLPRL